MGKIGEYKINKEYPLGILMKVYNRRTPSNTSLIYVLVQCKHSDKIHDVPGCQLKKPCSCNRPKDLHHKYKIGKTYNNYIILDIEPDRRYKVMCCSCNTKSTKKAGQIKIICRICTPIILSNLVRCCKKCNKMIPGKGKCHSCTNDTILKVGEVLNNKKVLKVFNEPHLHYEVECTMCGKKTLRKYTEISKSRCSVCYLANRKKNSKYAVGKTINNRTILEKIYENGYPLYKVDCNICETIATLKAIRSINNDCMQCISNNKTTLKKGKRYGPFIIKEIHKFESGNIVPIVECIDCGKPRMGYLPALLKYNCRHCERIANEIPSLLETIDEYTIVDTISTYNQLFKVVKHEVCQKYFITHRSGGINNRFICPDCNNEIIIIPKLKDSIQDLEDKYQVIKKEIETHETIKE